MTRSAPSLHVRRAAKGYEVAAKGAVLYRTQSVMHADAFRHGFHAGWYGIPKSTCAIRKRGQRSAWEKGHAKGVRLSEVTDDSL